MVTLIKTKSERYTATFGVNKKKEKNSDEALLDQNQFIDIIDYYKKHFSA